MGMLHKIVKLVKMWKSAELCFVACIAQVASHSTRIHIFQIYSVGMKWTSHKVHLHQKIKINQKIAAILQLWFQHEWSVRTCRSVIASQAAASRAQGTLQYWVKGTMQPYLVCLQQKLPNCKTGDTAILSHRYSHCSIAMSTRHFRYSGFFACFVLQ